MTEAMPFLQKYDITFLRPPTIPPGGFLVPCRAGRSCGPAPGRLFAARQRKFCQRRLAARGQVDSTGPRAIIQRSQLCLLRQRWLPCAKGAVGERRLKDWQRDASPLGLQGSFSRRWLASAGVGVPTKHTAWESFGRPDAGLTLARDSRWHGTHAGTGLTLAKIGAHPDRPAPGWFHSVPRGERRDRACTPHDAARPGGSFPPPGAHPFRKPPPGPCLR